MSDFLAAVGRTGLQLLPGVGGAIAQAWSEIEGDVQKERITALTQTIDELILAHSAQKRVIANLERAYTESGPIVEMTARRVVAEADAEKRVAYAVMLFNALVDDRSSYDDKIDAFDALDSLTRRDIKTLKIFERGRLRIADLIPNSINPMASPDELAPRVGPWVQSLSKLEARGLIGQTQLAPGGFSHTGDNNHWVNRWRQKTFEILPFGQQLLNYLRG